MAIENIMAMRSEDGKQILLFDETDDFTASYANNVWTRTNAFEFTDVYENFTEIKDKQEVLRLLQDARSVLNQPMPAKSKHPRTA